MLEGLTSPCATGNRPEAVDGLCIMSRAAAIIRSVPIRWDKVAAGLSSSHSFSGTPSTSSITR